MFSNVVRVTAALVLSLAFTACAGAGSGSASSSANGSDITAVGSTALLPLVKEAAMDYQSKHPNARISVSGGGSMTGITQAAQKGADIGDSDVPAQNQPALVDHEIAVVPFAVAVNPKAGVHALTTAQIRGIFSGAIKNWRQAGGADQLITIINRPRSSGTRLVFVQKILGGAQPNDASLTQDSSGTVSSMIAQTPGAVSYIAMGYVRAGQSIAVSIDGAAPSDANVESGKYPFWSYEHMLTNGQPTAVVADFIAFVKNDTALLGRLHFIPVGAMKTR